MHDPDRPLRPSDPEHLADLRRRAEELLQTTGSELQAVPIADLEELLHELRVHHAELELQNDELRGAQLEIELSRDRYLELYDEAPVGYVTTDIHGRIADLNRAALELLGGARRHLEGAHLTSFFDGSDASEIVRGFGRLAVHGGTIDSEVQLRDRGGGTRWVHVVAKGPVDGADGQCRFLITDIESRKRLEDQLLQSQKLEAVGKLAGGIAHEFNNLMQAVIGHVELGLMAESAGRSTTTSFQRIREAATRAADLTRRLLAFSRLQVLRPEVVDLNAEIEGQRQMLAQVLGEGIEIHVSAADRPALVSVDRAQLGLAIVNLSLNARDAMPRGGRLTFDVGRPRDGRIFGLAGDDGRLGGYVTLRVVDTGCGMSSPVRERAFEPFFTTKGVGEGTGLGLATVYGIVRQHDGMVTLESVVGEGTAVTILLPTVQVADGGVTDRDPSSEAANRGGSETILVVEDEPEVLAVAVELLSEAGYTIVTARDGREAVQMFGAHADGIHMVVMDVALPVLGGVEARKRILEIRPGTPVLLVSAYDPKAQVDERVPPPILPKPYAPAELLMQVRDLLDG
jgi:PAS domain S-box-containing protein